MVMLRMKLWRSHRPRPLDCLKQVPKPFLPRVMQALLSKAICCAGKLHDVWSSMSRGADSDAQT